MDRVIGVLLVAASAVLVGFNPVLAGIVYRHGVDPLTFLFIRFAISTLILAALMRARRIPWPSGSLCRSLLGLGLWGMCAQRCATATPIYSLARSGYGAGLLLSRSSRRHCAWNFHRPIPGAG